MRRTRLVAGGTGAARARLPRKAAWWIAALLLGWLLGIADPATAAPEAKDAAKEELGWLEKLAAPAKPVQGLGQLLVRDSFSGALTRLNVARYHVNVVLHPPVALVQIDQSFYNPGLRQEEGTFVFNLPRGASVSRFAMYVTHDRLIEGELIERRRADNIYQTIVNSRRDPAILEQIGDNLFKMRVFPIFPKDTKRILLDFTLPLEGEQGEYTFRVPLMSDLQPIWDLRLSGTVCGRTRFETVKSPSHPETAVQLAAPEKVTFACQRQNDRPKGDFVLHFTQEKTESIALRSYLAEPLPVDRPTSDPRGPEVVAPSRDLSRRQVTYFVASVPATACKDLPAEAPGADVLILADTSTAIADLARSRRLVRAILAGLRPIDRFRLVAVDVAARPLHEGWCRGGGPETRRVLTRLDREFSLGGENLGQSVPQALGSFEAKSTNRRLVIYLGAGQNRLGDEQEEHGLSKKIRDAKACFSGILLVDDRDGRALLELLALSTGGLWFDLPHDPSAPRRLLAWLRGGVPSPRRIVSCAVEGAKSGELYYPTAWLPDRPLEILGRTTATDRVKLTLTVAGQDTPVTIRQELPVDRKRNDIFIGRLWAQRHLDWLRRDNVPEESLEAVAIGETDQEAVLLSQEWSLLSPRTAFLVLESEQEYKQWNVDRRRRRQYWSPPDAVRQPPLPPHWLNLAASEAGIDRDPVFLAARYAALRRKVREAFEAGDGLLAQSLIRQARERESVGESKELSAMADRVQKLARTQSLLVALGSQRALLEPKTPADWLRGEPNVQPLFAGVPRISPEFLRDHPLAEKLLQQVTVKRQTFPLGNLIDLLTEATGINVVVDDKALEDVGILLKPRKRPRSPEEQNRDPQFKEDPFNTTDAAKAQAAKTQEKPTPKVPSALRVAGQAVRRTLEKRRRLTEENEVEFIGWGQMSLRNYARFVLAQQGLVLVEEPYRLLVTTPEEAGNRLTTRVYPVADLLYADRPLEAGWLANPYLDLQLAAEAKARARLKQPLSMTFKDSDLSEAVQSLSKQLGLTMILDNRALDDVGVSAESPVNAAWRDVPPRESLRWLLKPLGLTYMFDREAIIITSPETASNHCVPRILSARGILMEVPVPTAQGGGM